MTPKEKAKELIHIYQSILIDEIVGKSAREFIVKQCALIAVDALLEHEKNFHSVLDKATDYLQEVKQEIEKL